MAVRVSLSRLAQVSHGAQFLAPCYFYICFINDIPDCISRNFHLSIYTMDYCIKLQDDLNALQQWERCGKFILTHQNVVISGYLINNTTCTLITIITFIILLALQETNTIKYLGEFTLMINSHGRTMLTLL